MPNAPVGEVVGEGEEREEGEEGGEREGGGMIERRNFVMLFE